jgi:hypothetical protein
VGRLSSFLSSAEVKNEWSYTSSQPHSYLYLYPNLKAMKETNIYAFEKGIFGCDEKRECRMETARTVRAPWQ